VHVGLCQDLALEDARGSDHPEGLYAFIADVRRKGANATGLVKIADAETGEVVESYDVVIAIAAKKHEE